MSRTDRVLIGVALICGSVVLCKEVLPSSVWLAELGVLVGAAISALFSWYYYQRAAAEAQDTHERTVGELRTASSDLDHLLTAVLQVLDASGIEARKDPATQKYVVRRTKDLDLRWRDLRVGQGENAPAAAEGSKEQDRPS